MRPFRLLRMLSFLLSLQWRYGAAHQTICRNSFDHSNLGAAHHNIISTRMHLQIVSRCGAPLLINEILILQILAVHCTLTIAERSSSGSFAPVISTIHNT